MLFNENTDFDPEFNYNGFTLGKFIHDDSDGFQKWDWGVYEFVQQEEYDSGIVINKYAQLKSLDISPYERDLTIIRDVFENWVDEYQQLEHGLEKSL